MELQDAACHRRPPQNTDRHTRDVQKQPEWGAVTSRKVRGLRKTTRTGIAVVLVVMAMQFLVLMRAGAGISFDAGLWEENRQLLVAREEHEQLLVARHWVSVKRTDNFSFPAVGIYEPGRVIAQWHSSSSPLP